MAADHYTIVVLVILVLSVLFSAFIPMEPRTKRGYLFIALGVLAFMTMFHSDAVGNDTAMYIDRFKAIASAEDIRAYIRDSTLEPGYILYCRLLTKVSDNPQILFIVSGFLTYVSIGCFLYKYSKAPGIIVFAMVTMMMFDTCLSAVRQTLALGIVLWAYPHVERRDFFRFTIMVLIGAMFHYSALVFLVVYPISIMKPAETASHEVLRIVLLLFGFMIANIGFASIIIFVLRFFPKYNYYSNSSVFSGEFQISIVLRVLVYLLLYIIPRGLRSEPVVESDLSVSQRDCGRLALLNIALSAVAMNASVLNRLGQFFLLFSLLDFQDNVQGAHKSINVIVTIMALTSMFAYGLTIAMFRMPEWYSTYPFSFCFS